MSDVNTVGVKYTSAGNYFLHVDGKEIVAPTLTINGEPINTTLKQITFELPYHEIETTDDAINLIVHEDQ